MRRLFSVLFTLIAFALTALSCSSDDDIIHQSNLAEITNFSLAVEGLSDDAIDYHLRTNSIISVPFGTSLTGVVPTIVVSENATISPASGEPLDFQDGETKSFIVTAEDGSTKEFTFTINQRNEIGSGSRLKTYEIADLYGENAISTYTYNESNFVKDITKETNDWGQITTSRTTFEYDSKNQIIAKNIAATNEKTVYTYDEDIIVKAAYNVDGTLTYTYEYTYNDAGDLSAKKRINHSDNNSINETKFVIENGNVIEEMKFGDIYVATYDNKNNPFIGMFPTAYAAISTEIQFVNTNNPIAGTMADNDITYEYNEDNYPISSSYTYFDNLATVDKTFTYFKE